VAWRGVTCHDILSWWRDNVGSLGELYDSGTWLTQTTWATSCLRVTTVS